MEFPKISADKAWEKVSNMEERVKWDTERWVVAQDLGEHEGGNAFYIQMPKPPVPLVAAREIVVTFWNDESYGEGKRAHFARSTTKEGAPLNSSNQLAEIKTFASIIEANGEGTKLTDIRFIDMAGSLPGMVIDKASKMVPDKNF